VLLCTNGWKVLAHVYVGCWGFMRAEPIGFPEYFLFSSNIYIYII